MPNFFKTLRYGARPVSLDQLRNEERVVDLTQPFDFAAKAILSGWTCIGEMECPVPGAEEGYVAFKSNGVSTWWFQGKAYQRK